MDVGLSSVRVEAAGAVRTALVSAENLHLSLKTGLSLEEQALTRATSPKDAHQGTRYCQLLQKNLSEPALQFQHHFRFSSPFAGYAFLNSRVLDKVGCPSLVWDKVSGMECRYPRISSYLLEQCQPVLAFIWESLSCECRAAMEETVPPSSLVWV